MAENVHHEHLIKELSQMLAPVFENSPQAVYLYLDDTHKICNQKFADMLGYSSIEEWVTNQTPVSDVAQKDQQKIINAYMNASHKFKASTQNISINNQKGKPIPVEVIMVPLSYQDEVFVLHFISND